jgi:hypothetical protein
MKYWFILKKLVIIERIQKALANNDFLIFLSSRQIYINSLLTMKTFYYGYLKQVMILHVHHKQNYLRRAFKLFYQYFTTFSSLSSSQLSSFYFSLLPLFFKNNVYVEWLYIKTKWYQQKTFTTKNQDLARFECVFTQCHKPF